VYPINRTKRPNAWSGFTVKLTRKKDKIKEKNCGEAASAPIGMIHKEICRRSNEPQLKA
jgi:hypothetical protein